MGESRSRAEWREAHTKRAKQEVIGHGMRAGQCRGASAWSSHNGRRGGAEEEEESSTVKAKQATEQNRGGRRRRGQIAQHRAHAKQRGSDVTNRVGRRGDGGGTGRAERRDTQMAMARDKAGKCSKIELYYSRHHDTPNGLRK